MIEYKNKIYTIYQDILGYISIKYITEILEILKIF
jgi:hypothetical protein